MTNEELTIEVGKEIQKLLAEAIFEIDGTPKLTVKREEGRPYTKMAMTPGAEFMLTDSYMGQREGLILCFSPVDAQPYTVEIPAKKVDEVFQNFGLELAALVKCEAEDTMQIINQMVGRLRKEKLREAEEAEEREKNRVANAYEDNPRFGLF